jgi:hypothetical protein
VTGMRPERGAPGIVQQDFCPSPLVPRGLVVEEAMLDGSGARICRAYTGTPAGAYRAAPERGLRTFIP